MLDLRRSAGGAERRRYPRDADVYVVDGWRGDGVACPCFGVADKHNRYCDHRNGWSVIRRHGHTCHLDTHEHADSNRDADEYADEYADEHADEHADDRADEYTDEYADPHADTDADGHADTDTNWHADCRCQPRAGQYLGWRW